MILTSYVDRYSPSQYTIIIGLAGRRIQQQLWGRNRLECGDFYESNKKHKPLVHSRQFKRGSVYYRGRIIFIVAPGKIWKALTADEDLNRSFHRSEIICRRNSIEIDILMASKDYGIITEDAARSSKDSIVPSYQMDDDDDVGGRKKYQGEYNKDIDR